MTWVARKNTVREKVMQDARSNGCCNGVEKNLNGFYQLSLLLTRDHEKAERCFVAGIEHLFTGNRSFNQWAHSCAKRIIIDNAIRELRPRPHPVRSSLFAAVFPYIGQLSGTPSGYFELEPILALKDVERFVFVLSVLDYYSLEDCALLLECSLSNIREPHTQALQELVKSVNMDFSRKKTPEDTQENPR